MCIEKGLICYNTYYLKSGNRFLNIKAKRNDLKISISFVHKSGEAKLVISDNGQNEKEIEIKQNLNYSIIVKKNTSIKIKIKFKHHSGSYKIRKENYNATQIK